MTVPDTITEWKAGAFCLSEEAGFGLAESTVLRAFQPFFLHLTLPYSVVRGEAFVLKGTVFSYLQGCIRVRGAGPSGHAPPASPHAPGPGIPPTQNPALLLPPPPPPLCGTACRLANSSA